MYLISILQTNTLNFTPRISTFLNREGLNPFSPGRPLGSALLRLLPVSVSGLKERYIITESISGILGFARRRTLL
jgi:hypothetical protein